MIGARDDFAKGPEESAEIPVWAADLGRLTELRAGLRERVRCSALCDGAAFTRQLEAAYRQMWQRWLAAT